MSEIRAEDARAPKLAGATGREGGWTQQKPRKLSTYLILAIVSAVTAIVSLLAAIGLGFNSAALACAVVALAAAITCAYFVWRELKSRDAPQLSPGDAKSLADSDRPLLGLEAVAFALQHKDFPPIRESVLPIAEADEATRQYMRAAAESASNLLANHTRIFAERLGEEQKRLTDALEIYGESIVSRLNVASVSVAREFRDNGEALNKRIEASAVAAVASITKHAEGAAAALAKAAAESEGRLAEAGRGVVARIEVVGAQSGDRAVALSEAAANRWERAIADLSDVADRNLRDQIEAIESRRQVLAEALDGESKALAERATAAAAKVESRVDDAGATVDRLVETALARIESRLDSRAEALAARLAELDRELELRWTSRSRGLVAELTGAASQAEAAAASASAEVARVAQSAAEAAQLAFVETAQDSARRWSVSADAAAREILNAADRSTRALSAHGETLSASLAAFETSVTDHGQQVTNQVDAQTLVLRGALDEAQGRSAQLLSVHGEALNASLAAFETSVTGHGQQVADQVDAQTHVLRGALDEAQDHSAQLLSAHGEALNASLAGFVSYVTDHGQQVASQVDAQTHALRGALDEARDRSTRLLSAHGEALSASLAGFESSVAGHGQHVVDSVDAQTHALRGALEEAQDRSTRLLSAHGEALSASLGAFEASVTGHGQQVVERLDAQTHALRDSLDEARTTVSDRGEGVVTAIHSAAQNLDGALAERSALLQQTFDAHRDALAARADTDAEGLRQLSQAHGDAVASALDDHRASLTAGLAETLADARRLADERGQEFAQGTAKVAQDMVEGLIVAMQTLSEGLGTRGAALRDQIVARQGEMIDVIEGGVARTERRFAESLRAAAEAVDSCGRTVSQILAQATQGLKGALTENAREAAGLIDASAQTLAQTLERSSRDGASELATSAEAQRGALERSVAVATGEVDGARARLAEAVDAAARDAEARLVTRGAETVAALRAGVEAASRTLEEERARFAAATMEATRRAQSAFVEGGDQSRRALDEETGRSLARLEAGRAGMAGAAGEALAKFEADFGRRIAELGASLEGAHARLNDDIASPLKANVERIQAEGQELSAATRALAETIVTTTSTHRERLHQAFADETDAMARILDANAKTFRSGLETVVSGADDVFLSRGLDVARAIAARVDELRTLLDGDALTLLRNLEARSQDLAQQIDAVSQRSLGDFERKASQLIGTLTRRGDDLLSAMAAASSESARKVGHLTGEVDGHTERAAGTMREMERKVGAMLAAVDRRSAELAIDPRARGGSPNAESEGPKAPSP